MISAYEQPEVINAALKKECEAGRILGPFSTPPLSNFSPQDWNLYPSTMVDGMSSTIFLHLRIGFIMNDFINPSTYSLSYCSVDNAYAFVNQLGAGTSLSKTDLKDAFRLIPIRPADWNLFGIRTLEAAIFHRHLFTIWFMISTFFV